MLLADRLRDALAEHETEACVPSRIQQQNPQTPRDKARYRERHRIEIMFGKPKDWRRIATRYDRCAHTFISDSAIEVIVIF